MKTIKKKQKTASSNKNKNKKIQKSNKNETSFNSIHSMVSKCENVPSSEEKKCCVNTIKNNLKEILMKNPDKPSNDLTGNVVKQLFTNKSTRDMMEIPDDEPTGSKRLVDSVIGKQSAGSINTIPGETETSPTTKLSSTNLTDQDSTNRTNSLTILIDRVAKRQFPGSPNLIDKFSTKQTTSLVNLTDQHQMKQIKRSKNLINQDTKKQTYKRRLKDRPDQVIVNQEKFTINLVKPTLKQPLGSNNTTDCVFVKRSTNLKDDVILIQEEDESVCSGNLKVNQDPLFNKEDITVSTKQDCSNSSVRELQQVVDLTINIEDENPGTISIPKSTTGEKDKHNKLAATASQKKDLPTTKQSKNSPSYTILKIKVENDPANYINFSRLRPEIDQANESNNKPTTSNNSININSSFTEDHDDKIFVKEEIVEHFFTSTVKPTQQYVDIDKIKLEKEISKSDLFSNKIKEEAEDALEETSTPSNGGLSKGNPLPICDISRQNVDVGVSSTSNDAIDINNSLNNAEKEEDLHMETESSSLQISKTYFTNNFKLILPPATQNMVVPSNDEEYIIPDDIQGVQLSEETIIPSRVIPDILSDPLTEKSTPGGKRGTKRHLPMPPSNKAISRISRKSSIAYSTSELKEINQLTSDSQKSNRKSYAVDSSIQCNLGKETLKKVQEEEGEIDLGTEVKQVSLMNKQLTESSNKAMTLVNFKSLLQLFVRCQVCARIFKRKNISSKDGIVTISYFCHQGHHGVWKSRILTRVAPRSETTLLSV